MVNTTAYVKFMILSIHFYLPCVLYILQIGLVKLHICLTPTIAFFTHICAEIVEYKINSQPNIP